MASRATHRVRIPKTKKFPPPDTAFAKEMAAKERQRHEEFVGDFHERWAERLQRPTKLIMRFR